MNLSRGTIFLLEIMYFLSQHLLNSFLRKPQNGNCTNWVITVHLIKSSYQPNFSKVSHPFLFLLTEKQQKKTGRNRNFTHRKKLPPGSLCPAKTKRIPPKPLRRRFRNERSGEMRLWILGGLPPWNLTNRCWVRRHIRSRTMENHHFGCCIYICLISGVYTSIGFKVDKNPGGWNLLLKDQIADTNEKMLVLSWHWLVCNHILYILIVSIVYLVGFHYKLSSCSQCSELTIFLREYSHEC